VPAKLPLPVLPKDYAFLPLTTVSGRIDLGDAAKPPLEVKFSGNDEAVLTKGADVAMGLRGHGLKCETQVKGLGESISFIWTPEPFACYRGGRLLGIWDPGLKRLRAAVAAEAELALPATTTPTAGDGMSIPPGIHAGHGDPEVDRWIDYIQRNPSPRKEDHIFFGYPMDDTSRQLREISASLGAHPSHSALREKARRLATQAFVGALERKYPRAATLPKWDFPPENAPEGHGLTVRIGQPITQAVANLGPPSYCGHGLGWDEQGIEVDFGWVNNRASFGLVTGIRVKRGFKAPFYGLRLGDPERAAIDRWGAPDFKQQQYRLWWLQEHGVDLVVRIADGTIEGVSVRCSKGSPSTWLFDTTTGYPSWQASP
jgi:hypothetical protein